MYAITGASGQLGTLVIDALLTAVPPDAIVALARNPAKLAHRAEQGVAVREFDYDRAETLVPALQGVDRLLLISSSEVGKRGAQHRAVIDAAKEAGVGHVIYTSILHAADNPMNLAVEHRDTEAALADSGLPHTVLRNGWYTENYAASAASAVRHGALLGSAGDGPISAASRADYAAAAVTVLTDDAAETRIFELAGDEAFTLAEFAAAIAAISGTPVVYKDMSEDDYRRVLEDVGLPTPVAAMLAESDAKAARGSLYDDGRALSRLIGRPTTPWRDTLAAALRA